MSEMIKHGIEEANKELIQENQEKIMQDVSLYWISQYILI